MDRTNEAPVGSWNPTPEQFEKYLEREVELARRNLKRPGVNHETTLHSFQTILRARAA